MAHVQKIQSINCSRCSHPMNVSRRAVGVVWYCPNCDNELCEWMYEIDELDAMGAVLVPMSAQEMGDAIGAAIDCLIDHAHITGGDIYDDLIRAKNTVKHCESDFTLATLDNNFTLATLDNNFTLATLDNNFTLAALDNNFTTTNSAQTIPPQMLENFRAGLGIKQTDNNLCEKCAHSMIYHTAAGCTFGQHTEYACECDARGESEETLTEEDVTSDEIPDMIASGYEWTCPECDSLQDEIEIKPIVRCRECKNVFETAGAEHAYEN